MNRETLLQIVHGLISEKKQMPEAEDVVIVTAKRIGRFTHNGTLDFGGSEYTEAPVEWIEPEKKNPDDDYGWWMLEPGDYLVEYNESVTPARGMRCYLQIWDQAARNGLSQSFRLIAQADDPLQAVVRAGSAGVGIKENARVSVVGVV